MAAATDDPAIRNFLLSVMRAADRDRLRENATELDLEQGQLLFDAGARMDLAVFPHTAVISLLILSSAGDAVDVGTVGCEGVVGAGALTSAPRSTARTIVQVPGRATAVDRRVWNETVSASPSLQKLLDVYRESFVTQLMQSVACNALHSAEQRFARWLLMTGNRSQTDQVALTHDFLAQMVGVRRPTITLLARTFQSSGLISNRRGHISIVDRPGLEEIACECYGIVRAAYARLLELRR